MKEQVDIVIITALDKERNAVLAYLQDTERIVHKNRIFYRGRIYKGGTDYLDIILLSLPYMGNVNSSIAASQAIDVWNPRYVILTGIAGGFKGKERFLGDILIGEQLVYYEQGKEKIDHFSKRFLTQQASSALINFAHNYQSEDWISDIKVEPPFGTKRKPKVHYGLVASGEKVIVSKTFGEEMLKIWPKMIGVEMEGFGAAAATFQAESSPGFIMIKSICDWADSSKNDNWQNYAAYTAASYTVNFLRSLIGTSFNWKKRRHQAVRKERLPEFNGRIKICLCRNLLDDWYDLADYFDIPPHHQRRFENGRECRGLWEWLEARGRLDGLKEALKFIERDDLIECFKEE